MTVHLNGHVCGPAQHVQCFCYWARQVLVYNMERVVAGVIPRTLQVEGQRGLSICWVNRLRRIHVKRSNVCHSPSCYAATLAWKLSVLVR